MGDLLLNSRIRLVIGLALSLLSACLLFLSMPPFGLWPLATMGFVPMLIAQYRFFPAKAASVASAITVGGYLGGFFLYIFWFWLGQFRYFWVLPVVIGVIVFFTDRGSRALHERTLYRWFIWQGAIVWVAIEMIRNQIPSIGTSGFVGYAYYRVPWMIQPVSIVGLLGLDLLSMIVAYYLGLYAIAHLDHFAAVHHWPLATETPVPIQLVHRWGRGLGLAVVGWLVVSLCQYFAVTTAPIVRVAAIQPVQRELSHLQDLSRQAAGRGAQIIVWPEGTLRYDPKEQETEQFRSLARETGAYLVIGHAFMTAKGQRNELSVVSPEGEFLGVYGKDHPLSLVGETSISRGSYPVYQIPQGGLGTIICYDLEFSDTARRVANNGAKLLAIGSNDWPVLAGVQYPYLLFRAVENRVATVKADTQYDSMVIDAKGRLLVSELSTGSKQAIIMADVAMGSGASWYSRCGDWVGWLAWVGLLFFALPNPLLYHKRSLGG